MSPHHNIILYRNISNDFAEKLVFKIKEKQCEERRFGVWKTLKTQELPGALPPGPPLGRCPWTPPGALERAPGPHAVKTLRSLRSLRSTWTQTIILQHPAVTNPAHAHALGHLSVKLKMFIYVKLHTWMRFYCYWGYCIKFHQLLIWYIFNLKISNLHRKFSQFVWFWVSPKKDVWSCEPHSTIMHYAALNKVHANKPWHWQLTRWDGIVNVGVYLSGFWNVFLGFCRILLKYFRECRLHETLI